MPPKRHPFFIYGQLIREGNATLDKTYVYEYNGIGNLNSVKRYSYTTDELSGTPGTTSFSYLNDKLTSFGSKAITYNTSGGVSSYDGWDYTWSKGRLNTLRYEFGSSSRAISKPNLPSFNSSKTYSFTYNALGQRLGVNYNYFIADSSFTPVGIAEVTDYSKAFHYDHAGRLISESTSKTVYGEGNVFEKIVFLYDEGSMIGMEYTSYGVTNTYYYLRNLQGDVIGIYDTSGNLVVKYNYDSWGNCTIASGTTNRTLARANPIRYRGYYYDEDTGLYYLNARYYNPEWRRFISPDDTGYLDPETPNGLNLYAYCNNDPVNYADPSGHSIILTAALTLMGIGITVGIGYATYTDYQDDSSINGSVGWQTYVGSAMIGGAIGFGLGYFGPAIASFLGSTFTLSSYALASGELVTITISSAKIAGGAVVAGIGLSLMAYESKKAAPRIKSNTKKQAYDKAFHKGGKKDPIYHPNGKYGPHYHPANPKFKHWHYYFSFIFGILGIDSEFTD